MNVTKVLKDAYELIDKVGWVQNEYELWDSNDKVIGYCLTAAIDKTVSSRIEYDEVLKRYVVEYDEVMQALRNASGDTYAVLTVWNDTPGRTKEEVLNLLSKACE